MTNTELNQLAASVGLHSVTPEVEGSCIFVDKILLRKFAELIRSASLEEATDQIEKLEKRLEIDPRTKYDTIDCRNVTIIELEEQIRLLESELALQELSDFNQVHGL
jgi:hypothetical protein